MKPNSRIFEPQSVTVLRFASTVILLIFLLCFVAFILNCATTGPQVTSSEEEAARKELKSKAIKYKFGNLIRINNVGRRLVASLPEEEKEKPVPYTGILVAKLDKEIKTAYEVTEKKGTVAVGIVKGSWTAPLRLDTKG